MSDWDETNRMVVDRMAADLAVKDREIAALREALIEATAELIYLRQHGKDGAVWWANESKDVWRDKARAALEIGVEK
jgi:hypothetical protein